MKENRLTALAVQKATTGGLHDGGGLYLQITAGKAGVCKSWLFRYRHLSTRTDRQMGLGPYPQVSLAEARKKREEARNLVRSGIDPIDDRKTATAAKARKTFGECAGELIDAKSSEWRNEKHLSQWHHTLEVLAAPLAATPVDEVDTVAVLAVLKPLWQTMPVTASRLRGRIEAVLDYAKAHGWRSGENPSAWRGHLALILPKRGKLSRDHHAAMPYTAVPDFMMRLGKRSDIASKALAFLILTATRTGEVLGAQWAEVDLASKVWTIPASRMKSGIAHRVPLSEAACAIAAGITSIRVNEFVFPSLDVRSRGPMSGMAMLTVLRRMGDGSITVHGFRSSFRDWAGEETGFPREICEAALAHGLRDKTEAAYRRGDALERRRALMEAWASYCEQGAKVVALAASR